MNFEYIFLLNNFYSDDFIPPVKNCNIIIPWDKAIFENKKNHFLKLNNTPVHFCFALNQHAWPFDKAAYREEVFNSMTNFFFLPNYLKAAEAYLLATDISLANDAKQKEWADTEKLFSQQGLLSLSVNNIYEQDSPAFFYSAQLAQRLEKKQAGDDLYFLLDELIKHDAVNKKIIIAVNSKNDFFEKQELIQNFENNISVKEANLSAMIAKRSKLNADIDRLSSENKKLKFHLTNHHDYLKILKETTSWHVDAYNRIVSSTGSPIMPVTISNADPEIQFKFSELQKQASWLQSNRDEILKWYTSEYEILPLWYKRFGHIIKVFKGKRTFKSLFK